MLNVLVTGGEGQLANNIKDISKKHPILNIIYQDSKALDITNEESIKNFYNDNQIDYCINCAAYTAVDKAESDQTKAFNVNELGTANLSKVSAQYDVVLIHISTDFVFDGKKSTAYSENDCTNPLGIYGLSKLKGEEAIQLNSTQYFIIRTSWLYSEHNSNFMKTMLNLAKTRQELKVVDDQIGTPTYAKDLARVILKIIASENKIFGLYHYSNEGSASWYDFAKAIFEEQKCELKLVPIKSLEYPTPAKRPEFSVLDKTKIKQILNIDIPNWRDSLKEALRNINKTSL